MSIRLKANTDKGLSALLATVSRLELGTGN